MIMCTVKHCAALFVHAEILIGAKALEMSQLLERYLDLLVEVGIHAPNYRCSKLKNRLRKVFGDNLSFRQPIKKSQSELALKEGFIMDSISPTEPNCRDSGHG